MDPLTDASRQELLDALTERHRELLRPGEKFDVTTSENARGVRGVC